MLVVPCALIVAVVGAASESRSFANPLNGAVATTASGTAPDSGPGDWAAVKEAAVDEGRVLVYTAIGPAQAEQLLARFEEAHPEIDASYVTGTTGDMIPRLNQERDNNIAAGADVALGFTDRLWYEGQTTDGNLQPLAGPSAELWAALDGEALLDGTFFVSNLSLFTMLVNTEIVTEPITSYEELASREDLRGQIGSLSLGSPTMTAWLKWQEDRYGTDFITAMAEEADVKFYANGAALVQAVGAGEVGVAWFITPASAQPVIDSGAPAEMVYVDPTPTAESYAAALGWGSNPNAAAVFVDWVMSVDGQTAMTEINFGSALGDAVVQPFDANFESLRIPDFDQAQMDEMLAHYRRVFGS